MKKLLIILSIFSLCMILYQNSLAQNIDNKLGWQYDDVGFYIINSENDTLFTCLGNGRVGIGTKTPINNLDVFAPSGGDGISVSNASGYDKVLISASGGEPNYGFVTLYGRTSEEYVNIAPNYLHLKGTGVLFERTIGSGTIPTEGPGMRMMWYPAKAAFRVGSVGGEEWNDENIGYYSTAMGASTKATSYMSLAIGKYNFDNGDSTQWEPDDFIFTIGDGDASWNRSNLFYIKKNGNIWWQGIQENTSDARLKTDINRLNGSIDKIKQINGVNFCWKDTEIMGNDKHIGVLAQDVEKVFPELVGENEGYKTTNYIGLIPVLIEALKEQQQTIEDLKSRIEQLENL